MSAVRTVMIWYIILMGAKSMKGSFVTILGGWERYRKHMCGRERREGIGLEPSEYSVQNA
jgi:hypothetical protein